MLAFHSIVYLRVKFTTSRSETTHFSLKSNTKTTAEPSPPYRLSVESLRGKNHCQQQLQIHCSHGKDNPSVLLITSIPVAMITRSIQRPGKITKPCPQVDSSIFITAQKSTPEHLPE